MRILARIGAALLLLPLLFLAPGAAQAHDTLVSSNPKDGATTAPISTVTLTFNAAVLKTGAAMQVTGPAGDVAQGSPVITGAQVSQPLRQPLAGGSYKVLWRVLSGDGHPISGTFQFTVQGAPTSSSATDSAASSASESASSANSADKLTAQPSTSSAPTPPVQQVPTSSTDNNAPLIIAAAVLALLLIAGGAFLSRSRLKDDNADLEADRTAHDAPEDDGATDKSAAPDEASTKASTAPEAGENPAQTPHNDSPDTNFGHGSQNVDRDPDD